MSSRDWNTIGAGATLPRWIRWAILPPLIPLAGMAWLAAHWGQIPLRFGRPPMTRTPLHVFAFPIFASGLALLIVGLMLGIWYGSRRPANPSPMEKIPLAVAYLLSTVFTAVSVSPITKIPEWTIAALVPLGALATIIYVIKTQSDERPSPDNTPDECWSLGGIYHNPKDPSMFVPARMGYGYVLNLGNPWSYRIMVGFFSGIALLIGFLFWALH